MIKRQLLTLVCALGLTSLCLAQQMAEHTVYFDYGKHDLQEQYKTSLDSVLLSLPANLEDYRIELIGHTDSDGDKDFNQALSENRCNAVRSHLLSRSIDDGQIIALEGKNYTDSVATNATEQGKALNRRVEILFQWDSELPPPHHGHLGTPVAGLGDYLLSNPLAGMRAPTTSVTFRPEDGVEFTYDRSGTVVKIPADMLVYANGQPVVGEVQVDYIEWRDAVDFIGANIPMTYGKNGDIFNSAGMFEIKVTQGDQNVYVKNGGYYDIDFQLANDTLSNLIFFNMILI